MRWLVVTVVVLSACSGPTDESFREQCIRDGGTYVSDAGTESCTYSLNDEPAQS